MRLEQLTYMIEIAKTHSFSLAAENLFIGQSTLSEAIKKLETELAVPLFTRTKNGVYLTDVGQEILDIALQMSRLADQVKTVAQQANPIVSSDMSGELDISVSIWHHSRIFRPHCCPFFRSATPISPSTSSSAAFTICSA